MSVGTLCFVNCGIDDAQDARFQQIRTYEVVSQVQPEKEILLTLVEDGGEESSAGKAAYYKDVGMRTLLRKTRAQVTEFVHLMEE